LVKGLSRFLDGTVVELVVVVVDVLVVVLPLVVVVGINVVVVVVLAAWSPPDAAPLPRATGSATVKASPTTA